MRNVKTFLTNNDESIIKKMNSKSDIVEKKIPWDSVTRSRRGGFLGKDHDRYELVFPMGHF